MGDLFLLSGRNPAQTPPSLSLSTAQLRSMISGEMHSDSVPHTYSEAPPLSGCPLEGIRSYATGTADAPY